MILLAYKPITYYGGADMKIWKIAAALAAMLLILPTAYADEHRHCSCGETKRNFYLYGESI